MAAKKDKAGAKSKGGRPTKYTPALAAVICSRIADGESLRAMCATPDMPDRVTVFRWIAAHDEFRNQYARAREAQADTLFEEILDIADDGWNDSYVDDNGTRRTDQEVIARSRLRVDARKWMASKLAPKKYGDRQEIDHTSKGEQIKSFGDMYGITKPESS